MSGNPSEHYPEKTQTWTTTHGDTVTVWLASRPGELMDWRWHVQDSGNHEVVGHGEGHTRRSAAREAAMRHHPPVASEE